MKRVLLTILTVIVLAIIGGVIWLSSLDGHYNVERSITINNSAYKVSGLVTDFNQWKEWSPWLCMEPDAKVTISADNGQEGAIYAWSGELVGSGEIEHLKIENNKSISQEIRFTQPWESQANVGWTFDALNDSTTKVTWSMNGEMPFFMRFMTKYMEPMIGMDYDRGLKMMKDFAETGHVSASIESIEVIEAPAIFYLGKRTSCKMDEMEESMTKIFSDLTPIVENSDIGADKGISIYHNFDFLATDCDYTAGFTTKALQSPSDNTIVTGEVASCNAIKVVFKGDYKHLGNAWSAAYAYAQAHKKSENKKVDMYELYLTDPQLDSITDNWITEIYLPIK